MAAGFQVFGYWSAAHRLAVRTAGVLSATIQVRRYPPGRARDARQGQETERSELMNAETQPPQTCIPSQDADTRGFHFNWGIAHAHVPNRDHRDPTPVPAPAPGLGGGAGGGGLFPPRHQH
jgi:hypothetical protein